jgi:hypothetical protein
MGGPQVEGGAAKEMDQLRVRSDADDRPRLNKQPFPAKNHSEESEIAAKNHDGESPRRQAAQSAA